MALKIHKVRNLFSEKAKHQTTSEILTLSLSIKNKPNMAYSRDLSKMARLQQGLYPLWFYPAGFIRIKPP